jgi:hypothetical protein
LRKNILALEAVNLNEEIASLGNSFWGTDILSCIAAEEYDVFCMG